MSLSIAYAHSALVVWCCCCSPSWRPGGAALSELSEFSWDFGGVVTFGRAPVILILCASVLYTTAAAVDVGIMLHARRHDFYLGVYVKIPPPPCLAYVK